ncbi:Putative flippase GtrA (transmembrane translocase of bactoprenol-linked glucose) [Halopelagius inordinatus]|uniref:Putative flippase GtrA (Transmembrane translocase of bactoprenol-linked glucose) n=1 Tax=Halopelagius inordinatus TaxID=553467 RepID=A0A1I2MJY4_9EURY|nr:GtrA family protein [Halopelagius inordinatus]SFF91358.1 Putative flippase GtrA (transmembrane translocase of bactoprenol-linked glucose) [Halopelagius inordinatus]
MSNSSLDALLSGVRFGKFVSVGAVGAVFDMATTTALIVLFGVLGEYAKLAGAEVAIVVMFLINEHWTFAEEGAVGLLPTVRRFLTSNLVRSGGLALQFLVVRALRQLDVSVVAFGFDFWQVIPIPIAIAASMLVNYVAESTLTWRIARP